ncbi:P-loop containing nucleoside triphosphate hydrolase protein [Polychaeton citri CBS 116435]|uniref:RNA helicase n=1 Tax=Polychaeton citri CBS 116435 TaxID=1314669 RepID=A0A9P4PZC0_9PEZI|nr:P-loop containing nucleoside triphosphate hydrolase protein [Polychaeton citri CBS 116435]
MARSPGGSRHHRESHRRRSRSRESDRRSNRDEYRPRESTRHDEYRSSRRRNDSRERSPPRHRRDNRHAERRYRSRSRDRRDRSPVRDGRRDRDRYRSSRYDDDYDRDRDRARHRSRSSRGERRTRDDSRDKRSARGSVRGDNSPRPSTSDGPNVDDLTEEQIKRRKRLDAIKARQQASKGVSPATESPAATPKPINEASISKTAGEEPLTKVPAVTRTGFSVEEIRKKAQEKLKKGPTALGDDVVINKSAVVPMQSPDIETEKTHGKPKLPTGNTKISGLSLSKATADGATKIGASRVASGLDDEEESGRKLEKLPDLPEVDTNGDAPILDDDDGEDLQDEEQEAAAARQAAEKRAQEVQVDEDIDMTDTNGVRKDSVPDAMDQDEDVDPLDAFMNDLDTTAPAPIKRATKKELRVYNSDDEDQQEAVGDGADDLFNMTSRKKRKEIPAVDHSKMEYEEFRKNFYSEPTELADMTQEEVDLMRADLDNINVQGKDPPKPITKFSQGGFGSQILDILRDLKFENPTPIQAQALPAIMGGRDVLGIAKTGSGKTMAFLLPMFRHIKDQRPLRNMEGPVGLVLAPTRELATQIHRDCKPFLKALGLRAVCAYGGPPIKDQIAELKRGAEIVVATAGRLIDLLASNSGRVINLNRVSYVVLDEADRMFDMGFEPQITKIINNVRPDRQTVLFSATFPKSMEALAKKATKRAVAITVGGKSIVPKEITQHIEVRPPETRDVRLLELLGELEIKHEDARTLVFVERQETADRIFMMLNKNGYPAMSIHGGREQLDRDQAIDEFKAGHYAVLVATSVAARGLDVKQLKLVINYDSPNHKEDYVHRAGRTGRAGNTGTAITFVSPDQFKFAPFLVKVLEESEVPVPPALTAIRDECNQRIEAGEFKKISSGFGGRGIDRLDAERAAERARERGMYKTGDEPEEEEDKKEGGAKSSDLDKKIAAATSLTKSLSTTQEVDVQKPGVAAGGAAGDALVPKNLQAHISSAMKVQKTETPPPSSGRDSNVRKAPNAFEAAQARAAAINARLGNKGAARPGGPPDNRGPDAGAYHSTLEINDFPQKARWAVTNRTNVAKILEATGTSITSKGNYYGPGTEPASGEQPKLYVLVEGDTEPAVSKAMGELVRLLKEGTVAAAEQESRAPTNIGRYSVV